MTSRSKAAHADDWAVDHELELRKEKKSKHKRRRHDKDGDKSSRHHKKQKRDKHQKKRKSSSSSNEQGLEYIPSEPGQKSQQKKQSTFACTPRFLSNLPPPPIGPKLLKYPFKHDRLIKWCAASLELDFNYEMRPDWDLGIPIDLINPQAYQQPEDFVPHPDDEDLLRRTSKDALVADSSSVGSKKGTAATRGPQRQDRVATWLRPNFYLSAWEDRKYGDNKSGKSFNVQETFQTERESSAEDIEKSFAASQQSIPPHPTNPALKAVQVFPIVPSPDMLRNQYTYVAFHNQPAAQIAKLPFVAAGDNAQETAKQLTKKSTLVTYDQLLPKQDFAAVQEINALEDQWANADDDERKQIEIPGLPPLAKWVKGTRQAALYVPDSSVLRFLVRSASGEHRQVRASSVRRAFEAQIGSETPIEWLSTKDGSGIISVRGASDEVRQQLLDLHKITIETYDKDGALNSRAPTQFAVKLDTSSHQFARQYTIKDTKQGQPHTKFFLMLNPSGDQAQYHSFDQRINIRKSKVPKYGDQESANFLSLPRSFKIRTAPKPDPNDPQEDESSDDDEIVFSEPEDVVEESPQSPPTTAPAQDSDDDSDDELIVKQEPAQEAVQQPDSSDDGEEYGEGSDGEPTVDPFAS